MGYRGQKKGNYGNSRKGSSSKKGKSSKMASSDWTDKYIRGEISEQTWRRHMNADRRANAPSIDDVLAVVGQRASEQGFPQNDNDRFNGWTNWDTWELMLLLNNSQPSYNWLEAWKKNFGTKINQGKFDPKMAEDVVRKYLIPVARGTRKPPFYDQYREFTPDSNIDPKKVNLAEVVHNMLSSYKENMEYEASQKS